MGAVQRKKIVYPISMLDYFKGAGMLVIILYHCRKYSPAIPVVSRMIDEISSGALLFFFLAAGFGLRKTKPVKMLKKAAKEEILPYLFCGVCSVLLIFPAGLIAGDRLAEAFGASVKTMAAFLLGLTGNKTICGIQFGSIGPAWFFLALFWGIQIVNLIIRTEGRKKQIAIAILLTGIGYISDHYITDFFCISKGLQAVLPVYMGYLLRSEHYLDRMPKIAVLGLLAYLIGYPLVIHPHLIHSLWVIKGFARYLFRTCGVIFLILLSIRFCRRKGNLISKAIRYVGCNSFLYLVVHTIEYECIPWPWLIGLLGLSEITESGNFICFILRLCVCAIAVRIIEKPFKKLIADAPKSKKQEL